MSEVARPDDYEALLGEIRGLLQAARTRAYQAVDNIKVRAYAQVGERIVRAELEHKERADHGARAIDQLARDLGLAHDWGVRELGEQIRSGLYDCTTWEGIPPPEAASAVPATRSEGAFRSVFHFEVPGLPADFSEAELEHALLENVAVRGRRSRRVTSSLAWVCDLCSLCMRQRAEPTLFIMNTVAGV